MKAVDAANGGCCLREKVFGVIMMSQIQSKEKLLRKVLLIEDSPADLVLIQRAFEELDLDDFELEDVNRLSVAFHRLANSNYDLILLDLSLPDSKGLQSFFRVREQRSHTPIVILTDLENESMAHEALREGAQDYLLKKELSGRNLLRTIKFSIERSKAGNAKAEENSSSDGASYFRAGSLIFNMEVSDLKQSVGGAETSIALTPLEFKILLCLAKNQGKHMTRQQLLHTVHTNGDSDADERSIDRHINSMRRKSAVIKRCVRSVYRVGYVFQPVV